MRTKKDNRAPATLRRREQDAGGVQPPEASLSSILKPAALTAPSASRTSDTRTLRAMLDLYCRAKHKSTGTLCTECRKLFEYATERRAKCPFGENKPTCAKCPVHCYKPAMRESIRAVMAYSGPRMLLHHPVMAMRHMRHGLRRQKTGFRIQNSEFRIQNEYAINRPGRSKASVKAESLAPLHSES
ncbi:MAG: nitrous oxide-stimulated promoter family protein [Kiritimatiellia bacterium]